MTKLVPYAVSCVILVGALLVVPIAFLPGVVQSAIAQVDPDWEPDPAPPKALPGNESPPGKVESTVETKGGRTVLKLGVEHSKSLSPVSDSLQAGSIFRDDLLNDGQSKLSWYPIPVWLAGQWRRGHETTVYSHDYASGYSDNQQRTFMSEQVADFGVQRDKTGTVWNCNLSGHCVSDRGSYRSIALVMGKAPVQTTPDSIIFREVFTIVDVNKTTNVILDSYLMESLTRHKRTPDGSLETVMSAKVYNASGIPRQVQENVAHDLRVTPYEQVDTYKGRDIRSEFKKFLQEKGLSQLVPE